MQVSKLTFAQEHLNQNSLVPFKHVDQDCLITAPLQLSDRTLLLVEEPDAPSGEFRLGYKGKLPTSVKKKEKPHTFKIFEAFFSTINQ